MNKMQLLTLSLLMPIFMGHAKNEKPWNQSQSETDKPHHQKVHPENLKRVKSGELVGFGTRVALAGTREVAVKTDAEGQLVVVSQNNVGTSTPTYFNGSVARYHGDGTLELLFENPTFLTTNLKMSSYYAQAVVIEPSNRIVVGYTNASQHALVAYHVDGSIDHLYHSQLSDGKLNALAVQPDGKVLVGSDSAVAPLVRYDSNGSLDNFFGPDNTQANLKSVNAIVIETIAGHDKYKHNAGKEGKHGKDKKHQYQIVVAGVTNKAQVGTQAANGATLVRYNMNGMVSEEFNFSGLPKQFTQVKFNALAAQEGNKIVVAGSSAQGAVLFRVDQHGDIDHIFSNNVLDSTDTDDVSHSSYNAVLVDHKHHNQVIVAGQYCSKSTNCGAAGSNPQFIVRRYSEIGVADEHTYGENGVVYLYDGAAYDLTLQNPTTLIAVGSLKATQSSTVPVLYSIKE